MLNAKVEILNVTQKSTGSQWSCCKIGRAGVFGCRMNCKYSGTLWYASSSGTHRYVQQQCIMGQGWFFLHYPNWQAHADPKAVVVLWGWIIGFGFRTPTTSVATDTTKPFTDIYFADIISPTRTWLAHRNNCSGSNFSGNVGCVLHNTRSPSKERRSKYTNTCSCALLLCNWLAHATLFWLF